MPGSASHFYLPEILSVLSIEDNMSFIGSTLRMYLAVCWSWVRVSSGWDSDYFPYSPPITLWHRRGEPSPLSLPYHH